MYSSETLTLTPKTTNWLIYSSFDRWVSDLHLHFEADSALVCVGLTPSTSAYFPRVLGGIHKAGVPRLLT